MIAVFYEKKRPYGLIVDSTRIGPSLKFLKLILDGVVFRLPKSLNYIKNLATRIKYGLTSIPKELNNNSPGLAKSMPKNYALRQNQQ